MHSYNKKWEKPTRDSDGPFSAHTLKNESKENTHPISIIK